MDHNKGWIYIFLILDISTWRVGGWYLGNYTFKGQSWHFTKQEEHKSKQGVSPTMICSFNLMQGKKGKETLYKGES